MEQPVQPPPPLSTVSTLNPQKPKSKKWPVIIIILVVTLLSIFIFGYKKNLLMGIINQRTNKQIIPEDSKVNANKPTGMTVPMETKYENPFDEKTQYNNPFSETNNPFDNLK